MFEWKTKVVKELKGVNVVYNGRIQYFPKYSKAECSKINDRNAMYIENDSAMIDASRLNKAFRITKEEDYIFFCPGTKATKPPAPVKTEKQLQDEALIEILLQSDTTVYLPPERRTQVLNWLYEKIIERGGNIDLSGLQTNIAANNGSKEDLAIIRAVGKLIGDHAVTANSPEFTNLLMQERRRSGYPERTDFQNLDIDMFNSLRYHTEEMAALISDGGFYKWQEENIKTGQIAAQMSIEMAQTVYAGVMFKQMVKKKKEIDKKDYDDAEIAEGNTKTVKGESNTLLSRGKSIEEINKIMQDSAQKRLTEILDTQSKTSAGPCLSEIYDPITGKIAFGQNFKTSATGKAQYYQWLEKDADPLIKKLVKNYENDIKSGKILLSEVADTRLVAHSEIVALDKILKNRRSLGLTVDESTLSELYLRNIDLSKAYKSGQNVPKIRCEHCQRLTNGINISGHN